MDLNLLYLLLVLLCGLLYAGFQYRYSNVRMVKASAVSNNLNYKTYCILMAVIFILLIAFRATSVGADTWNYEKAYYNSSIHFISQRSSFNLRFWEEKSEIGYQLLTGLFNSLGLPFHVFLLVEAALYVIPIMAVVYRYSENVGLSCFFFIVFFMGFGLGAIRQSMAMGFTALAFLRLMDGKKLSYFLLLLIACLFHTSALIFLLIFFLKKSKIKPNIIGIVLVLSMMMFYARSYMIDLVNQYTYYDYSASENTSIKLYLLFFVTSILSGLFKCKNGGNNIFIWMLLLSVVMLPIASTGALSRVFYYFFYYLIVLIPNITAAIRDSRTKALGEACYIIAGLYLTCQASGIYVFFWQS